HGYLVDMVGEMRARFDDAQHLPFERAAVPLQVWVRDLAPQLADRGALGRVGDDDEVPVLRVGRRRRLLRKLEALLQDLALDRPREIEPLAHRARRREELVRGQFEAGYRAGA